MKPKTFGDRCGLGCERLKKMHPTIADGFYCEKWPFPTGKIGAVANLLNIDPATNQITRCDLCLINFPVECKDCRYMRDEGFCTHIGNLSSLAKKKYCSLIKKEKEVTG
jgi:hypothetical protein